MIEIKNLSKSYGSTKALQSVNLELHPGEIVGLFGENGAGKTTLLKSLFNYIHYDGTILLDGQPITHHNMDQLSFGSSEHTFFPTLTALEHKEFYQSHFDHFNQKRFEGLMEFFQIPSNKQLKNLSFGQQNQFEVILALCQGATYIILDEPFAGNDVFNRQDFYKLLLGILDENETIVLSTHLIEEISGFISRAVLLHQGKIIGDSSIDELQNQGLTLMDYIKKTFNYENDRVSKALDKIL